jgi:hypothetical protein
MAADSADKDTHDRREKRMRGRKRLTPEEKLRRERKRWSNDNKRRSKETADSKWLRATNSGYIETIEVFHWNPLVEYLIWTRRLNEMDAESPPRIDEAVDDLFLAYVNEYDTLSHIRECRDMGINPDHLYGCRPNHIFRGRSGDGVGKVRVKVTMDLVERLGLETECDNRRKIRRALEELLFALYSNIADRFWRDPWPTGRCVDAPAMVAP